MDIRPAGPEHVEAVLGLVAEFHQVAHLPFSRERTGEGLKTLLENPSLGFVLIASEASVLSGYILVGFGYSLEFGGRDAFVDELYVHPYYQSQGIGSALLVKAEERAMANGIVAFHLESDFDNTRATALYESKGYRKHPRSLMTKWLGEKI